jgi:hypothetical protein
MILVDFATRQGLRPDQAVALPALWEVLTNQGFDPATVFDQAKGNTKVALYLRRVVDQATGGETGHYPGWAR